MGGAAVLDRGFGLRQGEILGLGRRRLGPRGVARKVGNKTDLFCFALFCFVLLLLVCFSRLVMLYCSRLFRVGLVVQSSSHVCWHVPFTTGKSGRW